MSFNAHKIYASVPAHILAYRPCVRNGVWSTSIKAMNGLNFHKVFPAKSHFPCSDRNVTFIVLFQSALLFKKENIPPVSWIVHTLAVTSGSTILRIFCFQEPTKLPDYALYFYSKRLNRISSFSQHCPRISMGPGESVWNESGESTETVKLPCILTNTFSLRRKPTFVLWPFSDVIANQEVFPVNGIGA